VVLLVLVATALMVPDPALARKKKKQDPMEGVETPETPSTPQRYLQEGLHYYQGGRLAMAKQSFENALKEDERFTEALYMLGMVYFNLADFRKAEQYLQDALDQNTFFTDAHNALGMVYQEMGQGDRAIAEWQIVLQDKSYPTPEVAAFNIGKVYNERGSFEQAAVYFRRAASASPKWARSWYALGLAQEELGNLEDGKSSYEKAIEAYDSTSPTLFKVHYRLGLVCYKLGYNVCSRENFEKVRELRPESPEGKRAREFLEIIDEPNPLGAFSS
jgi:Tfp pilus assembly protein PilF